MEGGEKGGSAINIFWSFVLDDLCSKNICKPKMIVRLLMPYSPLDDLVWYWMKKYKNEQKSLKACTIWFSQWSEARQSDGVTLL